MKKIYCFVLALLLGIAAPVARAATNGAASDNEILAFLTDPAAFTKWLEDHNAATHADALARIIQAAEKSQLNDSEKMQSIAVSIARVIRTSGPAAQEDLLTVARQVDARWLPVMVAAATLVGGSDGLATQKALIASYTGKDGWDEKSRAAVASPAQVLGVGITMRTSWPPGAPMPPLPPRWAARAPAAAQVIAATELRNPSIPVIATADLKTPSVPVIAATELKTP